jgi:hypothetical protein
MARPPQQLTNKALTDSSFFDWINRVDPEFRRPLHILWDLFREEVSYPTRAGFAEAWNIDPRLLRRWIKKCNSGGFPELLAPPGRRGRHRKITGAFIEEAVIPARDEYLANHRKMPSGMQLFKKLHKVGKVSFGYRAFIKNVKFFGALPSKITTPKQQSEAHYDHTCPAPPKNGSLDELFDWFLALHKASEEAKQQARKSGSFPNLKDENDL